jgi:hypothetical protein
MFLPFRKRAQVKWGANSGTARLRWREHFAPWKVATFFMGLLISNFIYALDDDLFSIYKETEILTQKQYNSYDVDITRKEFAHILVNVLEKRVGKVLLSIPQQTITYSDIDDISDKNGVSGESFKESILKLANLSNNDVAVLTPKDQFNPDNTITRYEVLALVIRTIKYYRSDLLQQNSSWKPAFIDLPVIPNHDESLEQRYNEIQLGFYNKLTSGYAYQVGERDSHDVCKNAEQNYKEDGVYVENNEVRCFMPNSKVNLIEAVHFVEKFVIKLVDIQNIFFDKKNWYELFKVDDPPTLNVTVGAGNADKFSISLELSNHQATKNRLVNVVFTKHLSKYSSTSISINDLSVDSENEWAIVEYDRDIAALDKKENWNFFRNYNSNDELIEEGHSFGQELKTEIVALAGSENPAYVSLASANGNQDKLIPPATLEYIQAGGYDIITFEVPNTDKKDSIFIENQADWLIYTGHGSSCYGHIFVRDTDDLICTEEESPACNFKPKKIQGYWTKDLEAVLLFGCSVLDIGDCNDHYNSNYYIEEHEGHRGCTKKEENPDNPNPGVKWRDALKDTNLTVLGFNGSGPLISGEGVAVHNGWILVKHWINDVVGYSQDPIDAWKTATQPIADDYLEQNHLTNIIERDKEKYSYLLNNNKASSDDYEYRNGSIAKLLSKKDKEDVKFNGENLTSLINLNPNAAAFDLKNNKYWYWSSLDNERQWGYADLDSTELSDWGNTNKGTCPFMQKPILIASHNQVICMGITDSPLVRLRRSLRRGESLLCSNVPLIDSINQSDAITVKINGQLVPFNWNNGVLNCDLYTAINQNPEVASDPLFLEIHDTDGKEIYVGYYPFKDVEPNRWYTKPIMKLWKEGVLKGYDNGSTGIFGSNNPALRAELITATVRAKELNLTSAPLTTQPFADVSIDEWYAHYVQYAKDVGLIQGCDISKNLFCPNKQISRVAAAKVIALGLLKNEVDAIENGQTPLRLFNDVQNKDDWFYPYVYALQNAQAVHGYRDGSFGVGNDLNRAEMAKMICIAKFGSMECSDM